MVSISVAVVCDFELADIVRPRFISLPTHKPVPASVDMLNRDSQPISWYVGHRERHHEHYPTLVGQRSGYGRDALRIADALTPCATRT